MTTQVAPWPLRFLKRHPVLVGVPLTYASFTAAITIQTLAGIHMMPWGWLIFALCFTPTLLCADYVRSWPDASVTLWMWFFCLMCFAAWGVQTWLPLPSVNLPGGSDRYLKNFIAVGGFMSALRLSQVCWSRFSRMAGVAIEDRQAGS